MNDYSPLPDRFESERNLISVITDDGKRFLEVFDIVSPDDFSQEAFGCAWRWFREMTDKGQRITPYGLQQAYSAHHQFAQFRSLLIGLADGVLPLFVKDYARDVANHARRERAQRAIARLQANVESARSFEEIADGIRELFEESCSEPASRSARKASAVVKDIEAALANPVLIPRYRTGFPTLDKMLKGGLRGGQLVIVAGRTGGGKTVLGMNLAVQAALDGAPVAAFSLEMSEQDLITRCIFSEGVHSTQEEAMETVRNLPLWVDSTSNITARGIAAKTKLLNSRHGIKVFVVDYLQLLGSEGGSRESRERVVADMSRTLKIAAKELDAVVIALSQVNADGELRESRAIEQDADVVLHVIDLPDKIPDPKNPHGPKIDGPDFNFFLRVSKHRGGEAHGPIGRLSGEKSGIPLRFHKTNFRFAEK
ncbi:MAG: primary replicative helicase [Verrucomicrobiales bacterium]|nr:primary replicative helicase [Verrucomicrobiales bacterium]